MHKPHWTSFLKGKRRERGTMNKTEARYADRLEQMKAAGEILWYDFDVITFRLAKKCTYTPDFLVMLSDGTLECHECKGFWADDAKVKIKVAADKFPFRFVAMKERAKKHGGGWVTEDFI